MQPRTAVTGKANNGCDGDGCLEGSRCGGPTSTLDAVDQILEDFPEVPGAQRCNRSSSLGLPERHSPRQSPRRTVQQSRPERVRIRGRGCVRPWLGSASQSPRPDPCPVCSVQDVPLLCRIHGQHGARNRRPCTGLSLSSIHVTSGQDGLLDKEALLAPEGTAAQVQEKIPRCCCGSRCGMKAVPGSRGPLFGDGCLALMVLVR
ncbi:hypothetical protein FBY31_1163 [Arthrobacter sp. SLBN-100]|nr:hypothetical protein FBY31_1163 [Arthrobacter sp. SLBN-100]